MVLTVRTRQRKLPPLYPLSLANQNSSAPLKAAEFISKRVSRATCLALSWAYLVIGIVFGDAKVDWPLADTYDANGNPLKGGLSSLVYSPSSLSGTDTYDFPP